MIPDKKQAMALLLDGLKDNPGPWGKHSLTAAHCAAKIAKVSSLDEDKAYVLGLLHDIGRKFGKRHLGHVSDGYSYMMSLGYDEVAKICLTHSFFNNTTEGYVGNFDVSEEELILINTELAKVSFDVYDRLICLCDAISGSDGVMDIIDRMNDVKTRYGFYNPDKWNQNLKLKEYFEKMMNCDIYKICEKDSFVPDDI